MNMNEEGIFSKIKFKTVTPEQRAYFYEYGKKIEMEGYTMYQLPNGGDVLIDDYKDMKLTDEQKELIRKLISEYILLSKRAGQSMLEEYNNRIDKIEKIEEKLGL